MSYRFVFATHGSLGDLHPYIAIAIKLKERGHQVIIATHELYQSIVQAEDIEFCRVRPNVSFDKEIISRAMASNDGTKYVLCNLVLPHLKDSYEDLMKVVHGADLLVTHPLLFAGPLVAEKTGIPWVSSVLAPLSLLSAHDPSIFKTRFGQVNLRLLSYHLNSLLFNLAKREMRHWSKPIQQLRSQLGLTPCKDPFFEGQHSPELVIALFSKVFYKAQIDWPSQTCVTGFIFYDGRSEVGISDEISKFIALGSPPIVFTLGSAAVHDAGSFYIESATAARKLGYRAILLIGGENNRHQLKSLLSEDIKAFDYAPYSQVFPHAAVIVHQGGIGTTAQALRAGRPMLITPYSHDQPDNAARAKRLGVARTIARAEYRSERVTVELKQLLNDARYARRAADVGQQIQAEDGVRAACDQIEARLNALI